MAQNKIHIETNSKIEIKNFRNNSLNIISSPTNSIKKISRKTIRINLAMETIIVVKQT